MSTLSTGAYTHIFTCEQSNSYVNYENVDKQCSIMAKNVSYSLPLMTNYSTYTDRHKQEFNIKYRIIIYI